MNIKIISGEARLTINKGYVENMRKNGILKKGQSITPSKNNNFNGEITLKDGSIIESNDTRVICKSTCLEVYPINGLLNFMEAKHCESVKTHVFMENVVIRNLNGTQSIEEDEEGENYMYIKISIKNNY
jgi:2,3-bisphosphoglycerate-independent phosphoglycerate mutase